MQVRLAGIEYESMVNGPGMRRVFFSQGCKHNCKGCFNPSTHSMDGGELYDIKQLVEEAVLCPALEGITFSGGDPFEQAEAFAYMAKQFKKFDKNIWCYTGYTFEYIIEHLNNPGWKELMENIDVLVDGKFKEDLKDDSLKYRGSSNQRVLSAGFSMSTKMPVYVSLKEWKNPLEIFKNFNKEHRERNEEGWVR